MDTIESYFEKPDILETIEHLTLENTPFILESLMRLQIVTQQSEWEASFYFYEKAVPGQKMDIHVSMKKLIDKLYSLEENISPETEISNMVRFLPNDTSILKLDDEHYAVFDHSEINSSTKVRRVRLVTKDTFLAIKQTMLDQINLKLQGLKSVMDLNIRNAEKLTNF